MKPIKTIISSLIVTLLFIVGRQAYAAVIPTGVNCSFSDAILSAQNDVAVNDCLAGSGADTISLNQDFTVTSSLAENAFPVISTPISIIGNSHTVTFNNNSNLAFRLFCVNAGGNLSIKDLNFIATSTVAPIVEDGGFMFIENANVQLNNVKVMGFKSTDFGGAIFFTNGGNLDINRGYFKSNQVTSTSWIFGGGVIRSSGGRIKISDSDFLSNSSGSQGGVFLSSASDISVSNSRFQGNSASYGSVSSYSNWSDLVALSFNSSYFQNNQTNSGGLISLQGASDNLSINNSLFVGNVASGTGAVIESETGELSKVSILNSTFSGNQSASSASVIGNYSNTTRYSIGYSTFVGNTSTGNYGVIASFNNSFSESHLENNIFSQNIGGECLGQYSAGLIKIGNLSTSLTCGNISPTNISTTLADNGGTTKTYALLLGSNAIDSATTQSVSIPCPAQDQRGVMRAFDGNGDGVSKCDIGAYEFNKKISVIAAKPTVK